VADVVEAKYAESAMPDRTPRSRPRSWLPEGLLGKPILFGSPLEGPPDRDHVDVAGLIAGANALPTMKDPVRFMKRLIEDPSPRR
jgi:hypothetical protein